MAMHVRSTSSVVLTAFFFFLIGAFWVVYLAGVARVEQLCADGASSSFLTSNATAFGSCNSTFGLAWFTMFLELFCILWGVLTAIAINSNFIQRFTHTLVFIVGIATVLLIIACDVFVQAAYATRNYENSYTHAVRTAAAGTVVLCILNFIWIVCATDKDHLMTLSLVKNASPSPPHTTSQVKSAISPNQSLSIYPLAGPVSMAPIAHSTPSYSGTHGGLGSSWDSPPPFGKVPPTPRTTVESV
mmetsp:Transcript_2314/g.3830  ORF Transcript_2314/g.3830 Transcript_2314/m.3830 type:complete len:244 (-) Transcript_2314:593-1324(-)|eukprot:CAMPEP_0119107640 /NCGR_PEP_ID=MMETSP1180-20130426/11517_1 /TAXON_ID=3052 ORGANISM="Chlamydomonas cf sp, Strain CCMP681" /NCGR_SAMPLE_ID=MMETSP1180 /ASSEMBLY_ACC=CAM_ASM_000741 /LENGTH=243 /DNA_ID=CAMNT_0007093157 /DNA_START=110 /DNA_END=841 /DNA_ORIENTATION=+